MKNKNKNQKQELFVLVWDKSFTLLEGLILDILKQHKSCSDEKIAGLLCLKPDEVCYILNDKGLEDVVDGEDGSHRELKSNFTGKEYQILTRRGKEVPNFFLEPCTSEDLDNFDGLAKKMSGKEIPKWLRDKKALAYYKYTEGLEKKYPRPVKKKKGK